MADMFDDKKFDEAKPNGGGKYVLAGFYPKVKIEALKNIDTVDGPATVLEFEIVESKVPECPPGPGYGYVMKAKHLSFFANVRRAIGELTASDFEKVTREIARACTGEVQPLKGTIAALSARNVKTRKEGLYTKMIFSLIEKSPTMKQLEAAKPA